MNPKVDAFFARAKQWGTEMEMLREIALSCDLTEELKWRCPCYTMNGRNIVLIHAFKEYCAMLFFKGALLKDPKHILVQQTENVQSARQARFTNAASIRSHASALKSCIKEAIAVEAAGIRIEKKKTGSFPMPDELREAMAKKPALKKAFDALTPGRQRGYLLYFSSAKQPETRRSRIEKYIPIIMEGKGLND